MTFVNELWFAVFNFEDNSYPMEPTVIRKRCVRTIELYAKAIGITTDGLRGSFRNHEYEQIQGRPGDVATAVRGRGRAAIEVVSDKRAAVPSRTYLYDTYMYVRPNFKQGTTPSFCPHSDQSDHFLRITPPTKRQKSFALSARVPSFERDPS